MSDENLIVITPIGRIVMGSPSTPTKYQENAEEKIFFALAIPKTQAQVSLEVDKNSNPPNEWGAKLINAIKTVQPEGFKRLNSGRPFKMKIYDGDDDKQLNQKGKTSAQYPENRGCWILRLTSKYVPKMVAIHGGKVVNRPDIENGDYVQVKFKVSSNGKLDDNIGVMLYPITVVLHKKGEPIQGEANTDGMYATTDTSELENDGNFLPSGDGQGIFI